MSKFANLPQTNINKKNYVSVFPLLFCPDRILFKWLLYATVVVVDVVIVFILKLSKFGRFQSETRDKEMFSCSTRLDSIRQFEVSEWQGKCKHTKTQNERHHLYFSRDGRELNIINGCKNKTTKVC